MKKDLITGFYRDRIQKLENVINFLKNQLYDLMIKHSLSEAWINLDGNNIRLSRIDPISKIRFGISYNILEGDNDETALMVDDEPMRILNGNFAVEYEKYSTIKECKAFYEKNEEEHASNYTEC